MSSRALRKLEKQRLEQEQQKQTGESQEESDDAYEQPRKPAFNAFSLLNEEESESEPEETESGKKEDREIESEKSQSPALSNKGKKKKKKQAAKKQKGRIVPVEADSDEELDRILAEIQLRDKSTATPSAEGTPNLEDDDGYDFEEEFDSEQKAHDHYDSNFKRFTTNRLKQSLKLLSVSSVKNLDPDQELSNLFGNLSKDTIEDANSTTSLAVSPEVLAQFRKLARLTRGWGGKDRRSVPGTSRKLLLSNIKDDYLPTATKPLNMDELSRDQILDVLEYKEDHLSREELEVKVKKEKALGVRYFKFNKTSNIQDRVANTRFYAATVLTPDPESLMQLLQQNPYHEETLLQVAMVLLRQGGDKSISNALVEKALFVFDRSFHKNFHELLLEGKNGLTRLPYEGFVNRQFYLALFRYIINMAERSMFYTAFSYCKFLLSLSPAEDPLGVRYFIDFYAILSEEYQYLIQFSESPLTTTYTKWRTPGIAFSVVLAHLRLGNEAKAKTCLELAYKENPYAAYHLLESVGLSQALPVKESQLESNDEIIIATETYLVRAPILWKEQRERTFLHDELVNLFKTQPTGTTSSSLSSTITSFFKASSASSTLKDDKEIPFNLIRFAMLSGENKIMAKLPETIFSRDDVFEFDVLPPVDKTVSYSSILTPQDAKVTDSLLDYVDQNLLGAIVQQSTQNDLDHVLDMIQGDEEA